MELPEKTLLNVLQNGWNLTEKGLTAEDIDWKLVEWREEGALTKPRILVKLVAAQRQQPAEPNLFDFTLIVQVVLWSRSPSLTATDKEKHWKMVEEVKRIVENASPPSGWKSMRVDSLTNPSIIEMQPEVLVHNLEVTATIGWTGT